MIEKYNLTMRILHWLMAIMLVGMIASGFYMVGLDAEKSPEKWVFYGWHKSFGMALILLILIRFQVRVKSKLPSLMEAYPAFLKYVADFNHKILYLLMLLVPVSGYLMSSFAGYPTMVFGITLPNFLEKNEKLAKFFHEQHGILPYILLALVVLHILAVLKYLLFDKKNILNRMI